MQNRYVGGVGDFGKYGLLRWICRGDEFGAALRLGVLWYHFDEKDNTSTNDGRHVQYLGSNPSRHERNLRCCDPDLFDKMLDIVMTERSIKAVETKCVLPPDTLFFGERLNFSQTPLGKDPLSGIGGW